MKVLRRIRAVVHDGRVGGRPVHDDLLQPYPPTKLIASGRVWEGQLKPKVDATVESLGVLVNGHFPGNILHAERIGNVCKEGRIWTGQLLSELRGAVASPEPGKPNNVGVIPVDDRPVDVTDLVKATGDLHARLIGNAGNVSYVALADSINMVRRAADAISIGRKTGDAANWGKRLTGLSAEQRQSGPNSPENRRAREFHNRLQNPPTTRAIGDSSAATSTAYRDAAAAVRRAKPGTPEFNALLNEQAKAFWSQAS